MAIPRLLPEARGRPHLPTRHPPPEPGGVGTLLELWRRSMTDKIGPKERQVRELREQRAESKKRKGPSPSELRTKVANIKQVHKITKRGRSR